MPGRPDSPPLTLAQRKQVLALACACDRLELRLLHQRRPDAEPAAGFGSATRFWPLVGLLGRLTNWGRPGGKISRAAKWLRFAGPVISLFL